MSFIPLFKRKPLIKTEDQALVVDAIRAAEVRTSGEIRVYIESHCKFVDPLDRAKEVFYGLEMDKTEQRNAVLVYIAIKDRQLALFGDSGIHQKTGQQFWNESVKKMISHFNKQNFGQGIATIVTEIGEALHFHFPYNNTTDKNELPDDIVFGK